MSWYWATTEAPRVCFAATGFGLGPRTAASVLSRETGKQLGPWRKVGKTGVPACRFEYLVNAGVVDQDINKVDARRRVWVDCLGWLRRWVPEFVREYDMRIVEGFFPPSWSLDVHNAMECQPLIGRIKRRAGRMIPKRNAISRVLVSFGGLETPFSGSEHDGEMPERILQALGRAATDSPCKTTVTACLSAPYARRFEELGIEGIRLLSPNRDEFLRLLRKSDLFVVQPGLYGPFEAFTANVTTYFTFPMTYTQMMQARIYDRCGALGHVPFWRPISDRFSQLTGDLECEEEEFFGDLASWWNEVKATSWFELRLASWAKQIISGYRARNGPVVKARRALVHRSQQLPTIAEVLRENGCVWWEWSKAKQACGRFAEG